MNSAHEKILRNLLAFAVLVAIQSSTVPFATANTLLAVPTAGDLEVLRTEARSYEHGEGVAKDPLRAATLYCDGARYGDAEAQFSLGWMYANGRGVQRSDEMAAFFFKLAATQGHEQAKKMQRFVGEQVAPMPECMNPVTSESESEDLYSATSPAQEKVFGLVRKLAPEYGVSPRLVMAVIRAESNFEPSAVSQRMRRV